MAFDYQQAFQRLKNKAQMVSQRYHAAIAQRDEARKQIEILTGQITLRDKEITQLKTEIENLTVVTTVFPSKEAKATSRKYLAGLVKEIDQCITDLTN